MATYSSVLAWRIPETGEPGGLPSVGLHSVGHDWSDLVAAAAAAAFPRALSMSEALCADPAWHAFAVCSLSLLFSLKLFQKHVVPFASPTGRCFYFYFYYLDVAVFMNWDKHLVGRSFISWSFQFEFHYFFCLPGEGKIYFLNTVFLFLVSLTDASSDNSTSADESICLEYQWHTVLLVTVVLEDAGRGEHLSLSWNTACQSEEVPFRNVCHLQSPSLSL